MELVSLLGVSFFLGMRHATDPDHVVAVTAIVAREGSARGALAIGALWGLGHTLTVLGVGSAIVVFGLVVPARLGLSMEMVVAGMLIVLGAVNLVGALRDIRRTGHAASGEHAHEHPQWSRNAGNLARTARPLVVGMVHGLAGSAAVALLVVATARSVSSALVYLLVFGVGTLLGMMVLTGVMVRPLAKTASWSESRKLVLVRVTGLVSVALGLFLVYRVGFVGGLFSATPSWIPR